MTRLLYSFYGDDYTGSSDVLESLAANGVETILFLALPTEQQRARFPHVQAIGVAGDSRSRDPVWMDAHLPEIFAGLKSLGAKLLHYKVCSTFDSAPTRGSIGRAMEIGARICNSAFVPVVVGAPHLRRYVAFGNLFAAAGQAPEIHRIDRHPIMSCHPATPMREADLGRHLAAQTDMPMGAIDLPTLRAGKAQQRLKALQAAGVKGVVIDGISEDDLAETGRLLWTQPEALFAAGSSGLTHGLLAQWRAEGLVPATPVPPPPPRPVDRLVAISGSCSAVTAEQIGRATAQGFTALAIEPARFIGNGAAFQACRSVALDALARGQSIVIHSALGPLAEGVTVQADALGIAMGQLLRAIVAQAGIRRVLVAGGDTSSHVVQQLGLYALSWVRPLETGIPLCRAHADNEMDGLELALKGGQVGGPDFFETVRQGGRPD